MFLFSLAFVSFLSSIYIYFRLKSFIDTPRHQRCFSIVFLLMALAIPGAELLAHHDGGRWANHLANVCFLMMAYGFYLFLILLLHDGLAILVHVWRRVFPAAGQRRVFRRGRLAAILIVPALIVLIGWVNFSRIVVSHYAVTVPRQSSRIGHLRVAVASDFHLTELSNKNFMRRFVELLNPERPDLVLLAGDIVEGDNHNADADEYARQFRRLASTYGVFTSLGNHEVRGISSNLAFFRKSGIQVLADAVVTIDGAFSLVGRNENHIRVRKSLAELLAGAPPGLPIIMMDHRPETFAEVSRSRVDIQVSGHTHGGQLYPFNYVTDRVYDLSWGYEKIRNTHFFVTSGIQGWGPKVRTAGRAEIMIIDVTFA